METATSAWELYTRPALPKAFSPTLGASTCSAKSPWEPTAAGQEDGSPGAAGDWAERPHSGWAAMMPHASVSNPLRLAGCCCRPPASFPGLLWGLSDWGCWVGGRSLSCPQGNGSWAQSSGQVTSLSPCCHDAQECGNSSFLGARQPHLGAPSFCLVTELPVPCLGAPPAGPRLPRTGLARREVFRIGSYGCEPLAHNTGVSPWLGKSPESLCCCCG